MEVVEKEAAYFWKDERGCSRGLKQKVMSGLGQLIFSCLSMQEFQGKWRDGWCGRKKNFLRVKDERRRCGGWSRILWVGIGNCWKRAVIAKMDVVEKEVYFFERMSENVVNVMSRLGQLIFSWLSMQEFQGKWRDGWCGNIWSTFLFIVYITMSEDGGEGRSKV